MVVIVNLVTVDVIVAATEIAGARISGIALQKKDAGEAGVDRIHALVVASVLLCGMSSQRKWQRSRALQPQQQLDRSQLKLWLQLQPCHTGRRLYLRHLVQIHW